VVRGLVVTLAVAALAGTAAVGAPPRTRPAASVSCGEISDGGAVWAPSGRFVAFTRVRASGALSHVFRIGVDGRQLRLLSAPGDYAYGVAWSPDGSHVAYSTFDPAAVVRVVVARSDGTLARTLATFQYEREPPPTFLAWSPDGKELAYVASTGELDVVQVDGSETRVIAHGATQPAWSPDGRRIAYVGTDGIIVAGAGGTDTQVIADGALPTWSPDGQRIAYESRTGVGVHVIRADGSGDKIVDARGSFPAWSRDGRRLVDVTESTGRVRAALRVVDLRRGRIAAVSHDSSQRFGTDDFGASFSPSGKTIVFTSASPTGVPTLGGSELRFVQPDGRSERRLTYHCAVVEESRGARIYGTWLDDLVRARNGLRDTVVCGRGRDVVAADRADRVAPDCESVTAVG
jgi:Tol biopolymer transport system component